MQQDWHPADIHAALKKRGVHLDKVGPSIGLHRSAGHKALHYRRWPKVKAKIAELLGHAPQEIWPSLFDANGEARPLVRVKRSHGNRRTRNICRTYKGAAA